MYCDCPSTGRVSGRRHSRDCGLSAGGRPGLARTASELIELKERIAQCASFVFLPPCGPRIFYGIPCCFAHNNQDETRLRVSGAQAHSSGILNPTDCPVRDGVKYRGSCQRLLNGWEFEGNHNGNSFNEKRRPGGANTRNRCSRTAPDNSEHSSCVSYCSARVQNHLDCNYGDAAIVESLLVRPSTRALYRIMLLPTTFSEQFALVLHMLQAVPFFF